MRRILITAAAAVFFAGCSQSDDSPKIDPAIYQKTAGIYEGILPAADCPGIRTTLYLRANKTYNVTSDYIERGVILDEAGEWTIDEKGIIHMKPLKDEAYSLQAVENAVKYLTPEGKPVEGEMSEFYVLKKN